MSIDVSNIKRHESFYAAGGDVVLLASKSKDNDSVNSGYVAFRLDTSTLSLWSMPFSEMIRSTIQSTNSDEKYDGAAAIFMPDSASDVESLLNALLHGFELPVKLGAEALDTIGPVLSMATKYKFERLRAHIVQLLECDWPTTTAAWLKLDAPISEKHAEFEEPQKPRWTPRRRLPEPPTPKAPPATWADFAAPSAPTFIRFARDHSVPSILPAAFYSLYCQERPYREEHVKFYLKIYRKMAARKTGSCRPSSPPIDHSKSYWKRTWDPSKVQSRWPSLTAEDVEVFENMAHIIDDWNRRMLKRHCKECKEEMKASGKRAKIVRLPKIFEMRAHEIEVDPLKCLRKFGDELWSYSYLDGYYRPCKACESILHTAKEAAIQDLWDSFRALFGLSSLRMPSELPQNEDPEDTEYETDDALNADANKLSDDD